MLGDVVKGRHATGARNGLRGYYANYLRKGKLLGPPTGDYPLPKSFSSLMELAVDRWSVRNYYRSDSTRSKWRLQTSKAFALIADLSTDHMLG